MHDNAKTAVEQGAVPGVVFLASDIKGTIDIHRSYGVKTLKNAKGSNPPITEETPLRMASFTKLVTSIMVLQAHEQGLLNLHEPVAEKLPEIAKMQVLTGYDCEGKPQLEDAKTPITLLHLLSHSSGCCYAAMVPTLSQWATANDVPLMATAPTIKENFEYPLAFQPGSDWGYDPGADWAGKHLELATGMDMEAFMQKHICAPLGISGMTFKLQQHPEMMATRGDMALRDPDTGELSYSARPYFNEDPIDCCGGMGVFMNSIDFLKIMQSILRNDGKLLKPASRDMLFKPVLSQESEKRLNEKGIAMASWKPHGLLTAEIKKSFALGGVLVTEDAKDWRRAGSISWSGLPNLFWTIDPQAGVCMMSAFQIEPWGDVQAFELATAFEKEVYAMVA